MPSNRMIRKVTDLKAQRQETYRYWRRRSVAERMNAIEEVVREAYFAKGIDLNSRPSNRMLVRVVRHGWKAA